MKRATGFSWRRRSLVALFLAFVGAAVFSVANAFADAGNPILGTIRFKATDNGNGTVTIYVRGQWNWLSHNSDCNFDRAGTGVGIIWNDSTEPGYTVSKGAISASVGISKLRSGDTVNQVDEMVHPVDRGNQVEGYTVAGVDYPAGQAFADPAPAAPPTAAQVAAWKGGCGREPLTATASKGANAERTGRSCADGTVACADHPWGSWGYEKNTGLGYSHTYLKSALPSKVCVNFYDVHGGGKLGDKDFQVPNGTKDITVDDNNDNSIQTNSFDVNSGANCIAIPGANVTTSIHNAAHQVVTAVEAGQTVHDFVGATGAAGTPSGNVTVDWFTNNTCSGAPQSNSGNVALNAAGQADATGFAKTPNAAGLFAFQGHYLGNGTYLPSDGPCEPLRVVDANIQITPATGVNLLSQNHTLTAHVNVNDGAGLANAPAGTAISFSIVSGPGAFVGPNSCTTAGATGSCSVVISSATAGTTMIRAATTPTVAGVAVHRESGDGKAGDSADANKLWAAPSIAILKEPKSQSVAAGGTATFTITVTNTGNVTLTDVTVVDPLAPNCNRTKANIPGLASMAPGAKVSYTCTRPNVTAAFDNVATATGTPPVGPPVTASDTAPVKIAPLTPAKKKPGVKAKKKKKKIKVVSHKKPKATG
jgi:uncharacterized repeat protein (TIGR01451 family)